MNAIPASLIAMVVGWAAPILGMAIGQIAISGRTADVGVTACWVGIFALIGWAAAVLPIVIRFGRTKLVSDVRWSWLGWSGMGVAIFAILLTPIMGKEALVIFWYPALMGCIAGLVFALLIRKRDEKAA